MKKAISGVVLLTMLVGINIHTTPSYGEIETNDIQTAQPTIQMAKIAKNDIDIPVKDFVPMETGVSDEDFELLALVTMAEAEGESESGQRLVVDTILNRMESGRFPDTIHGVVYQKNQFTSMWNGRADRCVVTDDIREVVRSELTKRTNYDVLYFRTNHYHSFGKPLFKVDNHYFSSC